MESTSVLLDNLILQQQEMEMLIAMFPGDNEVVWDDPTLPIDVEEFINSSGRTPHYLRFLAFTVNLEIPVDDEKIELRVSISLPTAYPEVHPTISVIANQISRSQLGDLNKDLLEYLSTFESGEMILLNLLSWLQENVNRYCIVDSSKETAMTENIELHEETCGMWLYMHHIYNKKEKRRNIIEGAEEFSLTGFSLPGKPGVVYVEGDSRNLEEYFDRLRRLSWRRITCKVKERIDTRVFDDFRELSFDCHGDRGNHMDMGKFFLFLKENGLGHMFKVLFGVEGHG